MVTMVCVAEESFFFFFKSLILRERSLNRMLKTDFSKYYQDKFFNVGKTKIARKAQRAYSNYLVLYGLKNEKSLISVLRK